MTSCKKFFLTNERLCYRVCGIILLSVIISLILFPTRTSNPKDIVYKNVETKNGAVRGFLDKTLIKEKPFFSFRGIPFAEPPIGELRFKVLLDKKI